MIKTPQEGVLLEKLYADDVEGAIRTWTTMCRSGGKCTRGFHNQSSPHLYCANMLHAHLLGKAIGGNDKTHADFHTQARKVEVWITEQI